MAQAVTGAMPLQAPTPPRVLEELSMAPCTFFLKLLCGTHDNRQ